MPLILKTKQDRQVWQYLTPNQREFAKNGKCINLMADFLPSDIPTRFVFVFIKDAIGEFVDKEHLAIKVLFESYLTLHFKDGVFKATQHPTKDMSFPFNLLSAVIRSRAYIQLPAKYQQLILSKVDMNFEHISEWVIC